MQGVSRTFRVLVILITPSAAEGGPGFETNECNGDTCQPSNTYQIYHCCYTSMSIVTLRHNDKTDEAQKFSVSGGAET